MSSQVSQSVCSGFDYLQTFAQELRQEKIKLEGLINAMDCVVDDYKGILDFHLSLVQDDEDIAGHRGNLRRTQEVLSYLGQRLEKVQNALYREEIISESGSEANPIKIDSELVPHHRYVPSCAGDEPIPDHQDTTTPHRSIKVSHQEDTGDTISESSSEANRILIDSYYPYAPSCAGDTERLSVDLNPIETVPDSRESPSLRANALDRDILPLSRVDSPVLSTATDPTKRFKSTGSSDNQSRKSRIDERALFKPLDESQTTFGQLDVSSDLNISVRTPVTRSMARERATSLLQTRSVVTRSMTRKRAVPEYNESHTRLGSTKKARRI
ncbi:hypothetical protein BP00DRAFT_471213 [Aspergillus indologenus CBS 114.80]|uniref:Uncharacterized protein n=1 Tax=Aspergillus indologenus CBS 114.80 TaxID=1450541 RepID=A0A2V5HQN0_9EURO|nr:hypothetical protein BP00DRAFT_471213 [Aspergillus indologenus CBS 114.80]